MARKRERNKGETPKLDMTAMIDVVFQLLIFFVVTLKQEDILSKLTAARPAASTDEETKTKDPNLITVVVAPDGFLLNGRRCACRNWIVTSSASPAIARPPWSSLCTKDSPHAFLVQALDICNKHGMTNLSIFTL